MADGYERRVTNDVVAMQGRAVSTGAAVGAGLEELGAAGVQAGQIMGRARDEVADSEARIALLDQQRRQSADYNVGMGELTDARIKLADDLAALPEREADGAVGYAAAATKLFDKATSEFLARRADPDVRERFLPMLARLKEDVVGGAHAFERTRFAQFQGESVKKWQDAAKTEVMLKPEAGLYSQKLADLREYLGNQQLAPELQARMYAAGEAELTTGLADGLERAGAHAELRALVTSEPGKRIFSSEQIATYLDHADRAEQIAARQAELAQKEAQQAVRDRISALDTLADADEDIPASAFAALEKDAKAAGLPVDELAKIAVARRDMQDRRATRGMSTAVIEQTLLEIQGRAGPNAKPEDARWTKALRGELERRGGREASQLAPLLNGGPTEQMMGLERLAGKSVAERERVAFAMGKPKAAVLAGLSPRLRGLAVQGAMARKDRDEVFLPALPDDGEKPTVAKRTQELDRQFDEIIGPDLKRTLGPAYQSIRDAALDLMAGQSGKWDQGQFAGAVLDVFGRKRRADGQTVGGLAKLRGYAFELPADYTRAEFNQSWARMAFTGAIYANGEAASPADIRMRFRPEYAGELPNGTTQYRLLGPNDRPLLRKEGKGTSEYMIYLPGRR